MIELNKLRSFSYHRQRLGCQADSPDQALRDVIGVYSWHPTSALSLLARVKDFNASMINKIDDELSAYRVPAMRMSGYLLPKFMAAMAFKAVIPPREDPYWAKRYSQALRYIPPDLYDGWRRQILNTVTEPMLISDIRKISNITEANLKFILNRMSYECDMLRVGSKNIRSNNILYLAAENWPEREAGGVNADSALAWLASEYFRAFGPARIKDFQWWAGVTLTQARKAVSGLDFVDIGDGLLLLSGDMAEFESVQPLTDTIDILPQWDSYTMGYAPDGRIRFLDPSMHDKVYVKFGATGGNALGIVLVNGEAVASWDSRFKGNEMTVRLNLFNKLSAGLMDRIQEGFHQKADLLSVKKLSFAY
jgi:hypothetical protein